MTRKRLAEINAVPYGSTGKITRGVAEVAKENGYEVLTYFSWTHVISKSNRNESVFVGSFLEKAIHIAASKITGYNGCFSVIDTLKLIDHLKKFKPDVIHLHILHSWYINLPLLFRYIKKYDIPVVWTMHDCWAFTGQCPHFTMAKCDKWKTGCYACPQTGIYPEAYVDQTKRMWKLKKRWFTNVNNMTIVTPSRWLASLVEQSFLSEYPVKVINNGIDLSVFKPSAGNFREKFAIAENKKIVLGVAFDWGKRKGLDVFIELAKRLQSELYQIVLVGTDDAIDKQLPDNIISIHRTQNQQELAEIYTAADVFVNPTREEVLGMVNIEANACGTRVITFDTGGSPECITEQTGHVVGCDDIDGMEQEIRNPCGHKDQHIQACVQNGARFDYTRKYKDIVSILDEITEKGRNKQ